MGTRFFNERIPEYISFTQVWAGSKPGNGRYWKRQLSKARRRAIKFKLRGQPYKEPAHLESEVNWKNW